MKNYKYKVKDLSNDDLPEFYKQICHFAASLLNNEYEYNIETMKYYANILLQYAKNSKL